MEAPVHTTALSLRVPGVSGGHVFGWSFDDPRALALRGPDLFVANYYGNSITEVSASTGALVRVISGHRDYFVQFLVKVCLDVRLQLRGVDLSSAVLSRAGD